MAAGRARRRVVGRRLAVGVGLLVVVAEVCWLAGPAAQPGRAGPPARSSSSSARPVALGGAAPAASGPARVAAWAHRLGPRVGIPAVALAAYGSAELALAREMPGCHLSWVVLAGIGSAESDHGRHGGAVLTPDGRSSPPIVGVRLDGVGVATIRDSDGGRLDGDRAYDRAIGPMQFLPATWRRWGADGDGDGQADPFALPDAALAAGRYLCHAGGGDLRGIAAWTEAVMAYNASATYLRDVTRRADTYATASRGG